MKTEQKKVSADRGFVLLALLLFSSLSFAATSEYVVFGFKADVDWILISYVVILILLSILGIAFMISRLFAMQQLEAWVKEEFIDVLFSIAILVFFTTFIGIIEQSSSSLANDALERVAENGQVQYWTYKPDEGRWNLNTMSSPSCPYPCHIYIARGFLGSLYEKYGSSLKGIAQYYFLSVFYMTENIGTGFDITFNKFTFELGIGFPTHAYLTVYNNILATVVSEYLKIISALKMQEIALGYLTSLAGILFIIGIVSRSVWFLRKFGGLLIAAGIGLYAIFPLLYVLCWYTIDRSVVDFTVSLPGYDSTASIYGGASGLGEMNLLFTKFNDAGVVTSVGMLDALGRAYIPIIIVPILAIFTTIGFIRHFSPMIGGDVEIAGLTRLI